MALEVREVDCVRVKKMMRRSGIGGYIGMEVV